MYYTSTTSIVSKIVFLIFTVTAFVSIIGSLYYMMYTIEPMTIVGILILVSVAIVVAIACVCLLGDGIRIIRCEIRDRRSAIEHEQRIIEYEQRMIEHVDKLERIFEDATKGIKHDV